MNKSLAQLRDAIEAAELVPGPWTRDMACAVAFGRDWFRRYDEVRRTCGAVWTAHGARLKASRIRNAIADNAAGIVRAR